MTALSFESVSKTYRGAIATNFREDVGDALGRLRGRRRDRPVVRALDDVSFSVQSGESFALVGDNGAGKTTALKIATRVAYPTRGRVRIAGRVGALIEVGTGMHPELTGRENIHLYGSIMGLSRAETTRKFDEIVDFSGVERALEQPLKQYSSGMQMRLGFSVAAYLEPDVLLVDEAIAVGDQNFQNKCVTRMSQLVREGRTLVFVSHDMFAVEALCERAIWMRSGQVAADGPTSDVLATYLGEAERVRYRADLSTGAVLGDELDITAITLHDDDGRSVEEAMSGGPVTVRFHYRTRVPVREPAFSLGLADVRLGSFALASMLVDSASVPKVLDGTGHVDCRLRELPLFPRTYELWGSIRSEAGFGDHVTWQRLRSMSVSQGASARIGKAAATVTFTEAPVALPHTWSFE